MPGNGSGHNPSEDIFDVYRVTGNEPSYRMNISDLSSHFDLIDDYLSALNSPADLELAEEGFVNYHRKGYLDDTDRVTVYASGNDLEKMERVSLDDLTDIVLGKKHESSGNISTSIPVEFIDGSDPYINFDLFMPTHRAVKQELKHQL